MSVTGGESVRSRASVHEPENCKGPGCASTVSLGGIQPKLSDEFAAFVQLTPDLLARLNVTVVDSIAGATGPAGPGAGPNPREADQLKLTREPGQ